MADNYNVITINSETFPRPVVFSPTREDVYASEYTTMTGAVKADVIGWKYSDIELKWDCLPQSKVSSLIALSGSFTFAFDDPSGNHSETVRRKSAVAMRHRYQQGGVYYWRDVSVKLSFLTTNSYS